MDLFSPVALGDLQLANRVVMAPLTRLRCGATGVPDELVVEHYRQRAGLGLIITEGVWPNPQARGYAGQPGIVTDEQIAGWREVADAVHERGGRIVMQLMHAGRVSHPVINDGLEPEAPSALAIDGVVRTPAGKLPYPVPHALGTDEIGRVVQDFVRSAENAIAAGLDGVELHGANGYLLHEFLAPSSNVRTDGYGGTPANRTRFVVETVTAVAEAIGAGRVGLRISPEHNVQGTLETDQADLLLTYGSLLDQLRPLGLAYLSVLHREPGGELVQELRRRFDGPLVANSGFGSVTTRDEAVALIDAAHAEAVAVGRAAIANPDLVERWAGGHPENAPQPQLFYVGGAQGYTDYPFLEPVG
ncbi:alkene reductase [Blastococcus sp. CCUG 61487]|uniref:alkene reductase n=1 Tax=Blastococcus sp. CCUG 61487 TaxID=1840703 RepID=UPI0010BFF1E6|nr:alkene reductase [Blastococcus sp. CCUG 61487]TKJ27406.1 alkene reductase [Blastococcus sp. CCUG 61487]